MLCAPFWRAVGSFQQSLPRKKNKDREQRENPVLEDEPGPPLPSRLAGEQPGKGCKRERDDDRQADGAQDREHLEELCSEAGDARRGILGALEYHRL